MSDEVKEVAIGISLNMQIDSRRQLCFQTAISQSASADELNKVLDKMFAAGDRKVDLYETTETIKILENTIKSNSSKVEAWQKDLVHLDEKQQDAYNEHATSGRRGEFRQDPKEKAARDNLLMNIKGFEELLKKDEEKIAELKAKL